MNKTTVLMTISILIGATAMGAAITTAGTAPPLETHTTCLIPSTTDRDQDVFCSVVEGSLPGLDPDWCFLAGGVSIPCVDVPIEGYCESTSTASDGCGPGYVRLGEYWDLPNYGGSSIRFYGTSGPCPNANYIVWDLSSYQQGNGDTWNNDISSGESYEHCSTHLHDPQACQGPNEVIPSSSKASWLALDNRASSICWR